MYSDLGYVSLFRQLTEGPAPNFGDFVLSTSLDKVCRKQEISVDNRKYKNGQDTLKTAFLAENK